MKFHVIDERHSGKVAGVYEQEVSAQQAIQDLKDKGGFSSEEVSLIPPNDPKFGQKLEPDSRGIGQTLLKSHLIFGSYGLVVGLVIAALLTIYGPTLTTSNPQMVFIALAPAGTFVGLLIAGLVTLRPDHDALINQTRQATSHNKWTVVVQTKDDQQITRAKQLMQDSAESLADSL